MNEILKEIESVFKMISAIPVSGDSVEIMATAKNKLRKIHADITAVSESKTPGEKQINDSEG